MITDFLSPNETIFNPKLEQLALAKDLLSEVTRSKDRVNITFTAEGALAFAKALRIREKESSRYIQQAENSDLIPKKDILKKFGITQATVYNWQDRGYLTPIKIGRKVFYRKEEIDNLVSPSK